MELKGICEIVQKLYIYADETKKIHYTTEKNHTHELCDEVRDVILDFVDEFAKAMKRLQIKQTTDEIKASEGLIEVSWGEAILDFLQSKFNLHSYREAEKITIGELLIAKRAAYNAETYRRKLSQIQTAKFRKK